VFSEAAATVILRKSNFGFPFEIVGIGQCFSKASVHELDVEAMCESMRLALLEGNISGQEVTFVHAAANGSLQGDLAEARSINMIVGNQTPVYASKALTGNTFGASGVVGLVHCMELCKARMLPINSHICHIEPDICSLINCGYEKMELPLAGYVLVNSFGFGGLYGSILLKFDISVATPC
jgi:3-oxoacyl-[acyl-carrier-protein] synthase II